MTADEYRQCLREGVHVVEFTKKNGEQRKMLATLDSEVFLQYNTGFNKRDEDTNPRTPSDDNVVVFDLEKEAWRCFKADSVISFTPQQ